MRIRMVHDRSGPRWDGQAWPPRGGEIDVPDDEGAALCAQGIAVPVVTDDAETPERPDASVEIRGGTDYAAQPILALRDLCRDRGLRIAGSKAELVERLSANDG